MSKSAQEFLLYQTEDGQTRIEVRMTDDTVWLSLGQMAELFGRDKSVISRHVRNVYEGELQREGTIANFATVQDEGGRNVEYEKYRQSILDLPSPVGRHFEEAVKKSAALAKKGSRDVA